MMAFWPHTSKPRAVKKLRHRWHSAAFLVTMFVLAMVALAATILSSRASSTPLLDESTMSAKRAVASIENPDSIKIAAADNLDLTLPVHGAEVTAIGFHVVNDDEVIPLKPNGEQANGSVISKGLELVRPEGDGVEYFIMDEGEDLKRATTGIDVGAPADTVIYAPVDGTIIGIKKYNIKGECPDVEVRIQAQNASNLVVVMTHIDNLEADFGQPVRAGQSRIGVVRELDSCMQQQLSQYTYDYGNHLHMQVENFVYGSRP